MGKHEEQFSNGLRFEIDAEDYLYFANAHNGNRFLRSIRVENVSGFTLEDVVLTLSIESQGSTLTLPWSRNIGHLNRTPFLESNADLEFDLNRMLGLIGMNPGLITLKVLKNDELIASALWSLEVHPPSFWHFNGQGNYELLTSFIQTQSPVLADICDDALKILGKKRLSASFDGYTNPEAVDRTVEALYEAVQAREISYSLPPASWELKEGQTIRLAEQVIQEGIGTCLDTALLFAALLERVRLYPILVLVPGHAYVGYWAGEAIANEIGPFTSLSTYGEIANLIDRGFIKLFETTVVCKSDSPTKFDDASTIGVQNLSRYKVLGEGSAQSVFIDVLCCRRSQNAPIRPIPVRVNNSDGSVSIVEYKQEETTLALLREKLNEELANRESSAGIQVKIDAPPMVRMWLDSLLDLTLRNPLINFRKPDSSVSIVTSRGALGVIEDMLQTNTFQILPNNVVQKDIYGNVETAEIEDDRGQATLGFSESYIAESLSQSRLITNVHPDNFLNKLRKMVNAAKLVQEETGSNGLYLALGMLHWKPTANKEFINSPLILVPVRITPKNRGREYYLSIDESGVTPNFSLVEKLRRDIKLDLPGLATLQTDDAGIDIDGTFDYVRKELTKGGFNDFRVDEQAVLGFFNFSSFRLWKDLLDNWRLFEKSPLVKHLVNTPTEPFTEESTVEPDSDLDDLIAKLPISADGSQAAAVAKALAGHTFVLQGPPGTGKSQTIANLLARALHDGKRVLFVAQKLDALEVVKERLDKVGLGAFSLDLFDKNLSSQAVRAQLDAVIDVSVKTDKLGFDAAVNEYKDAVMPLVDYRNRLHEKNQLGETLYSARMQYLAIPGKYELEVSGEFVAAADLETKARINSAAADLATLGPTAGTYATNPWSLSTRKTQFSESELKEIRDLTVSLDAYVNGLNSNPILRDFIINTPSGEDLATLNVLLSKNVPSPSTIEYCRTSAGRNAIEFSQEAVIAFRNTLISSGMNLSRLGTINISDWISQAQTANAGSGLMRSSRLKGIRKKVSQQLGSALAGNTDTLVDDLEKLRSISEASRRMKEGLLQIPGFRLPDEIELWQPGALDILSADLATVQDQTKFSSLVRESGPAPSELISSQSTETISDLMVFLDNLERFKGLLNATEDSIALWRGEQTEWRMLFECLPKWKIDATNHQFANLIRWIDLVNAGQPFEVGGLDSALRSILAGLVPFESATNAFLKGYFRSLVEILTATKGFSTFNGNVLDNNIRKLEDAHSDIRNRLPSVLGSELLERRGFDSSMRMGAIGDLIAAIRQPKKGLTLKTLLSNHWEIIKQITPLVLASPDSCVRFIDPSLEPFDLVVFDEASQIRVANSIGAIGRAKSAIVVGDSMQMPPTSVAQSSSSSNSDEEDEEALTVGDVESILSMCEIARVPDIMLSWHYRSDDEALIAFSNQKYYKGKLNTFPAPDLDQEGSGLIFEQVVGGQYIRAGQAGQNLGKINTNPAEAKAIIEEVGRRLRDPKTANDSIGIVTLNKAQQGHILELLQTTSDPVIADAVENGVGGEAIFVKNLETVQGSERDAILLSVAFSSHPGKPADLPLNFGPIVNNGGHRRLNVAITRARKSVKIFASFEPKTLMDKKPASLGLQHLAEYLALAKTKDRSEFEAHAVHEARVDRHRREILNALESMDIPVREEVGMSDFKVDLALMHPQKKNKAVLGILLDGARWIERATVSDRDSLPVNLLRDRMGWADVARIWLPAWLRDPQGETNRIVEMYKSALTSPPKPAAVKIQQPTPTVIYERKTPEQLSEPTMEHPIVKLLSEIPIWREFQPAEAGRPDYLDHLFDSRVQALVQDIARQLTDAEGPVSRERFAKFVAKCCGFNRVTAIRVDAINGVPLPRHQRDKEKFLFPASISPGEYRAWMRSGGKTVRDVNDISLQEISNAMADLSRISQGMRLENLLKDTISVFGIQRLTKSIQDRLMRALAHGLADGNLIQNGDYFLATSD